MKIYFWVLNGPFAPNKNFSLENLSMQFSCTSSAYPWKRFKIMRIHLFWGQKRHFYPEHFLFLQKCNDKPCSFHSFFSCLSIFKNSKSDVNILMKYWYLKKIKLSLDKSIFCHNLRNKFSQTCSFHRTLHQDHE